MDLETRLLFERAIGMLDALSMSAPKGIQEALAIATEMFDEALKKTPLIEFEEIE